MTFPIGGGYSAAELGDWLLGTIEARWSYDRTIAEVIDKFELSQDDARLAQDRACGGIVRAITGNPKNAPDPVKDPIAYHTFKVVWGTFPQAGWITRRRIPGGKWLDWYNKQTVE